MKKLMIVLAAVLISCSAYAQYAQFTFGPNVYSVDCYRNNLGDIVYVLPCMSPFKEHVQLLFTSEKVRAKFAKCLIWVKNKFAELNTTCYNDGITEIDKEMEYPNISKIKPIATFGDNITEARLDFYYVKKNNSTFVLLQVDKVESLSNSYIKSDGGFVSFSTTSDVQKLIDSLDEEKIKAYVKWEEIK